MVGKRAMSTVAVAATAVALMAAPAGALRPPHFIGITLRADATTFSYTPTNWTKLRPTKTAVPWTSSFSTDADTHYQLTINLPKGKVAPGAQTTGKVGDCTTPMTIVAMKGGAAGPKSLVVSFDGCGLDANFGYAK